MPPSALPQDLASLVHHVELSKAGWRERALCHLLLASISKHLNGVSPEEVYVATNASLPGPLPHTELQRHLDSLISKDRVVKLPNGSVKLTEATRREIEVQMTDAAARTSAAAGHFSTTFGNLPPRIQIEWDDFLASFLIPLVSELGAKTYQTLTGEDAGIEASTTYLDFLRRFPDDDRGTVCDAISQFVDPTSPAIRRYVLGLLNTAFLVRALTLPAGAVQELLRRTTARLQMQIFVDTNFLFSLLGLHTNPADDVVHALHELIDNMPSRVDVRLYMLTCTMDEARGAIERHAAHLSSFHLSRRVAQAIREGSSPLSGIALTYVREAYSGGQCVSAKDYFAPYLTDFIGIARSKGVEIFNASLDELRMDQQVLDDVAEQMALQEDRPEDRRKPYEAVLHDMMLWHFARRKRPRRVDSPLDAGAWVVTIDYGLLRFDAQKLRGQRREPVVCIHPTVLMQILQFWVPNSESLDAALLTSLRAVPPGFDGNAERVTVKIVGSLSRFEAVDDLSVETVTNVLLSDAVRGRIARATNFEEELEAVRTGVIEENVRLDMRTKHLEQETKGLERSVGQLDASIVRLRDEIAGVVDERESVSAELQGERDARAAVQRELERSEAEAELARQGKEMAELVGKAYWSAGIRGVTVTGSGWLIAVATGIVVRAQGTDLSPLAFVALMVTMLILAVGLGTWIAHRKLVETEPARATAVAQRLEQCSKWCWRLIGTLVAGLLLAGLVSIIS